jgi:hypothetical protein
MQGQLTKVVLILAVALASLSASAAQTKATSKPRVKTSVKRPVWIREDAPFGLFNEKVVALGKITTAPGVGTEEGYIIASNQARDVACKSIEHRIDFIFQNSEEGSTVDASQLKVFTADTCKWFSSNSKRLKRYWEKVATTASNGDRVQVYHVFVTEAVEEPSFKKFVLKMVKQAEGKNGVEKGYSKVVRSRWEQFLAGE